MKDSFPRAFTVLYLLIPAFFFAVGWLKLPFMIVTLIVLTVFAGLTLTDIVPALRAYWANRRQIFRSLTAGKAWIWILLALGFVLAWMSLAGIGGIGHQNGDYTLNDPFFKLLITQDWPSHFWYHGNFVPVVYYVGYYLPAAFVGKLLGWVPANRFIFLWAAIAVFFSFYWFLRLSRVNTASNRKKLLGVAILFCLASGMDYIGYYVWAKHLYMVTEHIEFWSNLFVYSSQTSLLYWVPQQVLAGWLLIGLIGDSILHDRDFKYIGIAAAATVLWSPWAALGSIPFLVVALVKYCLPRYRRLLFNAKTLLWNVLALWVGMIHISFILASSFSFPVGFIWRLESDTESLIKNLAAFYGLEFAILAFLILLLILLAYLNLRREGKMAGLPMGDRLHLTLENGFAANSVQFWLFLVAFGMLWILPLFKAGFFNDFVMRTSMPILFVFWAFIAKTLLDSAEQVRSKFTLVFASIFLVVVIGFATSYSEIVRAVIHFNTGPDAYSWVRDFSAAESDEILGQRVGNENAFFFRLFGK